MTASTPCQRDPDAWFINRDGKQDPDDELLSPEDVVAAEAEADAGIPYDEGDSWNEVYSGVIQLREAEALRQALRRRRHAKDACHIECPVRLQCLELALDGPTAPEEYGTWGGYYAEELRAIRRARDRRRVDLRPPRIDQRPPRA